MAEVYLAKAPAQRISKYAIKRILPIFRQRILSRCLGQTGCYQPFDRSGIASMRIRRGIRTIYLVMDYVDGQNLNNLQQTAKPYKRLPSISGVYLIRVAKRT